MDPVGGSPARIDSLVSFRVQKQSLREEDLLRSSVNPRTTKDEIRRMTESMWAEGLKPGAEELRALMVETLITLYGATRAAKIVTRLDIVHKTHGKVHENTINSTDQEK